MKRIGLILLVIFYTASASFGQAKKESMGASAIQDDIAGLAWGTSYSHSFDNRYEGVKGTPFLSEDWQNGGIFLLSGKFYNNLKLKLDLYDDNLILKTDKGDQILLDKSLLDYFLLGDENGDQFRKFKVVRTPDDPLGKYYEVLYDKGTSSLLVKYDKLFVRADYEKAISSNTRYDEFKTNKTYYIYKSGDAEPRKIKLNKRSVKEVYGDQPDVLSFVRKNHLGMRTTDDWIELLKFVDSRK